MNFCKFFSLFLLHTSLYLAGSVFFALITLMELNPDGIKSDREYWCDFAPVLNWEGCEDESIQIQQIPRGIACFFSLSLNLFFSIRIRHDE